MRKLWWIAGGIVLAAAIAAPFLLPEKTVELDEAAPDGAVVERSGTWNGGDSSHRASGQIAIVSVDGEVFLEFMDFSMTAGPDVYLYLTESASPRSTADVEEHGIRVPVVTDADASPRLNERGSFLVALDMSLKELEAYEGVAAWCDDFNVLFASASL